MNSELNKRIIKAQIGAGRPDGSVNLIAVSKQQPEERIDAALNTGIRVFGENRVQEAQMRWGHRRALFSDLELHLIGPLQSNKAADAVALFDYIHTVDRPKIAHKLSEEMAKQDRVLPCFIQVNTGDEPQKSGISPLETEAFVSFCQNELSLSIVGLMCIPPIDEEAAMHFGLLRTLAQKTGLKRLSMGMSSDFETAIMFGATDIRLGSVVFGARPVR